MPDGQIQTPRRLILVSSLLSLFPLASSAAEFRMYVPFAIREIGPSSDVAYNDKFSSEITVMNVGEARTSLRAAFHDRAGTVVKEVRRDLDPRATVTLRLRTEFGEAAFAGSAVVTADQPLAGVVHQRSNGHSLRPAPTFRAFSSRGEPRVYLPTVLKNRFDTNTRFAVQNTSDEVADFTLSIYDAQDQQRKYMAVRSGVRPGAARHFDMAALVIPGFSGSGSAVIESTATAVGSAMELDTRRHLAKGFEGAPRGSRKVFMATALCQAFKQTTTYYAVQNTSVSDTANVWVDYSNGSSQFLQIAPFAKRSINPCEAGVGAGFSGAAQMSVAGERSANLVVMGKASDPFSNPTGFEGVASGGRRVALPYVRWSSLSTGTRTYIAIQNLADVEHTATVRFFDRSGYQVGGNQALAVAPLQKVNINFAAVQNAPFSGSALIEGAEDANFNVLARTSGDDDTSLQPREDYDGVVVVGELARAIDISQGTGPITLDDARCFVEDQGRKHIIVKAAIDEEWSGSNHNRDTSKQHLRTLWEAREVEGINVGVDLYLYVHWPPNLNFRTPVPDQVREAIALLKELDTAYPPMVANRLWIDLEETPPPGQQTATTVSLIRSALQACGSFPCGIYTRQDWWRSFTGDTSEFAAYPVWYAHYDNLPSFADWPAFGFGSWTEPMGKQYADKRFEGKLCDKTVDYDIMHLVIP